MSSLRNEGADLLMVRGGSAAGTPLTLDEVRERLAVEDGAAGAFDRLHLSMPPHGLLMVAISVSALTVAGLAFLVLPH